MSPLLVDRTARWPAGFAPDAAGQLQPVFAPATLDAEDEALTRRIENEVAEYARAVLASGLPAHEADKRMMAQWVAEILFPSRATVAAIRDLNHHSGLGDIALQPMLAHIRPLHAVPDIFRCIAQDRWVQASLRASGLGVLTPFVNLIIALELK